MPAQKQKNIFFGRLSKLTLGLILFFALAYLILGFVFDASFFARDVSEKYGRVLGATTLSVRVIGPPGKPTLSTEALCDYAGAPFIRLSWATTSDTDYYDLARDTNPLVSGVVNVTYDDYAVTPGTSYSYLITAFGVVGQTDSDPVIATTNICSSLPDPTINITKLDETPIVNPQNILQTINRTPTFYGHTNIGNAIIEIELNSAGPILGQTNANSNGFWEWTVPSELDLGMHLLEATAIDPLLPSRSETTSFQFEVIATPTSSSDDDDDDKKSRKKKSTSVVTTSSPVSWPEIKSPFSLFLQVKNKDSVVYSGQELRTSLFVTSQKDTDLKNQPVSYSVLDSKGAIVFQTEIKVNLSGGSIIEKNIALPRLLKNGRYKVIAQTESAGIIISADSFFRLQEPPLITAGPIRFTLTELMDNMSWIISILILMLLTFLILLSIEYWLYKHSQIHINEELLQRQGFLGKRKGVSQ